MAGVREDRPWDLPGAAPGRRFFPMLVLFLIAAIAAIALIWKFSRPAVRHAAAPVASGEAETTTAPPPPGDPEPAPAGAAAAAPAADDDEPEISARKQAEIARVIRSGRPGLKACYQRALTRDDRLVFGDLTVHLTVAPSGRVEAVNITGPRAFRVVEPCLERAVSRWTFPTAASAYDAEFPLVLQGSQ